MREVVAVTMSSSQRILTIAATVFFSLHFVSHHFHLGLLGACYHFVAVVAFFPAVFIAVAMAYRWAVDRDETIERRCGLWFGISLLMLFAALSGPVCKLSYCRGLPTGSFAMAFDRQAWAPMPRGDSSIKDRQKMLADVIKNVVEGSTYEDVRAALGPTEDASWLDESRGDILSYYMGPARDDMIPIDGEVLVIHFDAEGRVSRWYTFID